MPLYANTAFIRIPLYTDIALDMVLFRTPEGGKPLKNIMSLKRFTYFCTPLLFILHPRAPEPQKNSFVETWVANLSVFQFFSSLCRKMAIRRNLIPPWRCHVFHPFPSQPAKITFPLQQNGHPGKFKKSSNLIRCAD